MIFDYKLPAGEIVEDNREEVAKIKLELLNYPENFEQFFPDLNDGVKKLFTRITLEDRVNRGLNPMAILALPETRAKVIKMCENLRVDPSQLLEMTTKIQAEGPWDYVKKFKKSDDPIVKLWLILVSVCMEREMDLTNKELLAHLKEATQSLTLASQDPLEYFEKIKPTVISRSKTFEVKDGVPISEQDNDYINMGVHGFKSGIIQDADGILMVGAKEIPDKIFEDWGLTKIIKEDRGMLVDFWLNSKGEEILKKRFPGFVLVTSRNFEVAKGIVKSVQANETFKINKNDLEQIVYTPTSMEKGAKALKDSPYKKAAAQSEEPIEPSPRQENQLIPYEQAFYDSLLYTKGTIHYIDAILKLRKKLINEEVDIDEWEIIEAKTSRDRINKVRQKIAEVKYMISLMDKELRKLSLETNEVIDMAGGSGDLGLAIAMQMLSQKRKINKITIVDPMEEYQELTDIILTNLPNGDYYREIVEHETRALQEVGISENAIVVAKHACGDLADRIIEKWKNSKSPLLCIMTCCQGKARSRPAGYNISQKDWVNWCKTSDLTNNPGKEEYDRGMEAMIAIDTARVNYLTRFEEEEGIKARLITTNKFPKGDVIIAIREI